LVLFGVLASAISLRKATMPPYPLEITRGFEEEFPGPRAGSDLSCEIGGVDCDYMCWICYSWDDTPEISANLFHPTNTSIGVNVWSPLDDISFRFAAS
jgi:hypothetical protein